MNKKVKFISFIIITFMLIFAVNISYGTDETYKSPEKTDIFQKWESLSDEEKKNTIQPLYYNIDLKDSVKRSTYNELMSKAAKVSLESKYKMRDLTVKDQRGTGMCWAFSFSSLLEGSGSGKVYSPAYFEYISATMYNRKVGDGGNYVLAMGTCTSGKAPVLEEKMKFDDVYDEEKNSSNPDYLIPINQLPSGSLNQSIDSRITDATYYTGIFKKIDHGEITYYNGTSYNSKNIIHDEDKFSKDQVNAIRTEVKEHVSQGKPVTTYMYSDLAIDDNGNAKQTNYYNPSTGSYCCNDDSLSFNHEVTIVGWDDNYSVSNFNANSRPSSPGAWIVLNSFGNLVGQNHDGYMYVSYDDCYIEQGWMGIDNLEEYSKPEDVDYNIYQYDELGGTWELKVENTTSPMVANVFSKNNTKDEWVDEVGIFLPITEGVEIYINADNDDKTKLTEVATTTDDITPGYHIIKLSSPIKLTGSKFVIAAKVTNKEGASVYLEPNWKDSNITQSSNFFDTAKAEAGQSFISTDGGNSWSDINGTKSEDDIVFANTNVCLKAYTTEVEPTVAVSGVTLNQTSVTLEIGNKQSLIATVAPNNATNKNITWTSSNSNVVTVQGGEITAVGEGTAQITVTTEDGKHTAICNVTVNKKEVIPDPTPQTVSVTNVILDKQTLSLIVGDKGNLVATVAPNNATNKNVTWTSSNPNVVTVQNGEITAVDEGTAQITVTTEDGNYTAVCNVIVNKKEVIPDPTPQTVSVTGVTLNKQEMTLQAQDKGNLVATITPNNATNKNVIWTSSDPSVATVSNSGIITALKKGKTTITATTEDGQKTATCILTVTAKTNTEDDIYKPQINSDEKGSNKTGNLAKNAKDEDRTTANTILPFTGKTTFIIIATAVGIIATISFIKYRKFKDIK